MKRGLTAICDIILYLITFIVTQVFATLLCQKILALDEATAIIAGQASSAIITIALFIALRWTTIGFHASIKKPYALFTWIAVFTLCTLLPSTWIMELADVEMPSNYEKLFEQILSSPLGYVTVSLIVPITEEVVFRGAMLRKLLEWLGQDRRWIAIGISALIFAIAHGNLAQGPHAFLFGLFLGWLFYRTNSILPGLVFHWVNNTSAVVIGILTDTDSDATLSEIFGGNTTLMYTMLVVSVVIGIPSLYKIIKSL